jgi:hypothetical protein
MDCLLEKNEFHKVVGEIYKITNTITNMLYVGQTRSHRLNKGKYRPFGHIGRFKDHICESQSSKKNQCKYLNYALLKYGFNNFKCELIITCSVEELDNYEVKYINELNTKFPNGYNLTNGGQKIGFIKGKKVIITNEEMLEPPKVKTPDLKRSDYTKQLISERLKAFKGDINERKKDMLRVQNQNIKSRFDKYKNTNIDNDDIDKYIKVIRNNTLNYEYVRVTIEKMRTTFVGKYETIEEIKQRARIFILDIIKWQRDQIAGTSLESSLPLTIGNISEELG